MSKTPRTRPSLVSETKAVSSPSLPQAPFFLFDDSTGSSGGNAVLLEQPSQIIRADNPDEVSAAIEQLQLSIDSGLHAAGFFSYELGYALEPSLRSLMPERRKLPLIWFALSDDLKQLSGPALSQFLQGDNTESASLEHLQPSLTRDDYLVRFHKVRELIAAGDIYQANLTFRLGFDYPGPAKALYKMLRQRQPVPHGALLESPEFSILSLSPELFFELEKGEIRTRPMKGTMQRGATPIDDEKLSRQLQSDAKNRAENLMIVDLMRNDFARICEIGSVEVSDLYQIEAYPTLHQMTSGVRGRLQEDAGLADIVRALIPAGSITGAPKMRAQQIIRDLEDSPRGLYCGAMGLLSRDQQSGQLSARFNVAIRTLTLFPDGRGETGIGSGIVQDSVGEDEYEECLLKAKFLTMPDFSLIETMRLEPDGSFYLLDRHLDRLKHSCEELGFSCPIEQISKELEKLAGSVESGCHLVRLLLLPDGNFTLTSTEIDCPDPGKAITFCISEHRVDSKDVLLAHKTTRRHLFDEQWTEANKIFGTNEVLFLNEREELTEGSRSSLFIERDEKWHTPPLSCGLLPGTLREQLIEEGRAVETVLKLEDLEGAKIFFGNSVRGLQPARLVEE